MTSNEAGTWGDRLVRLGQNALAEHWRGLNPALRVGLERELERTDFALLSRLVRDLGKGAHAQGSLTIEPIAVTRKAQDAAADAKARAVGEAALQAGKVAALVVAGGQGSRLGHAGPKGTYPATPIRRKTLFQLFAEKIQALSRRYGKPLPLLVMTSEENHEDTTNYFASQRDFGLAPGQLRFFTQGMLPAVDESGALVVKSPGALFRSPNGHGGTLLALRDSGLLGRLRDEGVEDVFYFQVDNPLVEVCDPVFVGYHRLSGSEFSSKVVAKSGPEEKVGVLARQDGRVCVIEYSDLPPALLHQRNADGALTFSAGNIAIHVLSLAFVDRITSAAFELPFHVARKALPVVLADGSPGKVTGIKFETFIFDALAEARNPFSLEVLREEEFAPIKNATGVDSAETSSRLQSSLHARWLSEHGVRMPIGPDGMPAQLVEISPTFALDSASLRTRRLPPIDPSRPIYLGDE